MKNTLIKLLCLAIVCVMLIPMVIACGDDENTPTDNSQNEETVIIDFNLQSGEIVDDSEKEIEITKGSKLKKSQLPEVEKDGYEFVCWSYTRNDPDDEWDPDDKFREDTTLFAVWTKVGSGDNTGNGGNTDTSNPDGSGDGTDNEQPGEETITITYETGTGRFEDLNAYEKAIKKGSRYDSHPTPTHTNVAMKFEGWFLDSTYNSPVSPAYKYEADTTLYACWTEQPKCLDGSFEHIWSAWDVFEDATCTKAGTKYQYCTTCMAENYMAGAPATGHTWLAWQEGFLQRERYCKIAGCGGMQAQEFTNITFDVYSTVKLEGDCWGSGRAECVVDGSWDQGDGAVFAPKGTGAVTLTINLKTASVMDRIYVKGRGQGSGFKVSVQYEGASDYELIGMGSFLSVAENEDKENRSIPFVEPDNTKAIVSVKIVMESPSQGSDYWEEVAFVTIPPLEQE